MSNVRLIHGDCITEMQKLISDGVRVDLILTDPPYNTIKGIKLKGWDDDTTKWDENIPLDSMFDCCEKILRMGGALLLFSNEPYTCELRSYKHPNLPFLYPYYWVKDHFANNLSCNKSPVSYVEDISVFRKKYDSDNTHPLREYSKKLLEDCGSKKSIIDTVGGKADHFFRWDSNQFTLCTEDTYNELINYYHIDKLPYFKPYYELELIDAKFTPVFNLPIDKKIKPNVLYYKKSYNGFHPTEKPVELLEDLIMTYTNKGDVVLDFTMGSGSCGVACKNLDRDFIGIELNKDYFSIAESRINNVQSRLEVTHQ